MKGCRLLQDFILPSLRNETFGDNLKWDPKDSSIFMLKWTHKSRSSWSALDAAVFLAWDRLKRRPEPKSSEEFVNSKQRLRAALRNVKAIKEIDYPKVAGYRRYKVLAMDGVENHGVRKSKFTTSNINLKEKIPVLKLKVKNESKASVYHISQNKALMDHLPQKNATVHYVSQEKASMQHVSQNKASMQHISQDKFSVQHVSQDKISMRHVSQDEASVHEELKFDKNASSVVCSERFAEENLPHRMLTRSRLVKRPVKYYESDSDIEVGEQLKFEPNPQSKLMKNVVKEEVLENTTYSKNPRKQNKNSKKFFVSEIVSENEIKNTAQKMLSPDFANKMTKVTSKPKINFNGTCDDQKKKSKNKNWISELYEGKKICINGNIKPKIETATIFSFADESPGGSQVQSFPLNGDITKNNYMVHSKEKSKMMKYRNTKSSGNEIDINTNYSNFGSTGDANRMKPPTDSFACNNTKKKNQRKEKEKNVVPHFTNTNVQKVKVEKICERSEVAEKIQDKINEKNLYTDDANFCNMEYFKKIIKPAMKKVGPIMSNTDCSVEEFNTKKEKENASQFANSANYILQNTNMEKSSNICEISEENRSKSEDQRTIYGIDSDSKPIVIIEKMEPENRQLRDELPNQIVKRRRDDIQSVKSDLVLIRNNETDKMKIAVSDKNMQQGSLNVCSNKISEKDQNSQQATIDVIYDTETKESLPEIIFLYDDISASGNSYEPSVKMEPPDPYDSLPWRISELEAKYAIPPITDELPEKIFASDSEDEDADKYSENTAELSAEHLNRIDEIIKNDNECKKQKLPEEIWPSEAKDSRERCTNSHQSQETAQKPPRSDNSSDPDDELCRMMADPFAFACMSDEQYLAVYAMDTEKALYSYPFQWDKTLF